MYTAKSASQMLSSLTRAPKKALLNVHTPPDDEQTKYTKYSIPNVDGSFLGK